jgi:hypothetical protein
MIIRLQTIRQQFDDWGLCPERDGEGKGRAGRGVWESEEKIDRPAGTKQKKQTEKHRRAEEERKR